MAARAYWKGFLRLSLVSIAVEIYNAVESKSEISFRQIHKPSGRRINYTKTVQGIGEIETPISSRATRSTRHVRDARRR